MKYTSQADFFSPLTGLSWISGVDTGRDGGVTWQQGGEISQVSITQGGVCAVLLVYQNSKPRYKVFYYWYTSKP